MRLDALLLGLVVALTCFRQLNSEPLAYPSVYLRTRTIDTQEEAFRQQQRRLLGEALAPAPLQRQHHTQHKRWGALRGAHQWLLTHRPALPQREQAALVEHVEQAGCHIAHYLPDHTLVLVGSPEAAAAVEQHPHVLWLGLHDDQDKLAPEWQPILQQLADAAPQLNRLGAALGTAAGRNATAAARQELEALRDALPVASEWDAASGQLLVGAVVTFPGMAGLGARRAADSSLPAHQVQRARRVLLQRAQRDVGEAAAEDWAAPLLTTAGARIRRGSADMAIVLAPAGRLKAALDWLVARPATHFVAPAPKMRLSNIRASSISQSARPTASGSSGIDPTFHPIWAAGITGQGQVVGCGDSGIDRYHCFFSDPAFDSADAWNAAVTLQDGIRTFDSAEHRKIRYYRAYGDSEDSNGHGTHVVGTLVGLPQGSTVEAEAADGYIGMAPDAKVAFIDLADSSSDKIFTPSDLIGGYFKYTSDVGAYIHSDSWGTNDIRYDYLAQQVDQYSWENPEFLPVLPAGNEGQLMTNGLRGSGEVTVTSPANAKNCLSVGATQTAGEEMETTAVRYSVWDATVSQGQYTNTFRVMQANFGGSVSTLTGGKAYPLVVASPLDACSPLQTGGGNGTGGIAGAVVLVQRGTCYFSEKALAAQNAGAAAVLIFDNTVGAYFVARDDSGTPISLPVMAVTRRIGQQLTSAIGAGKGLTISFDNSAAPSNSFENLASYSSQGPTLDYRVKPDIVAPGTVTSALVGDGSSQDCGLTTMAGTSMATPVTAGSALLLRQYFTEGFYPTGSANPSDAFSPSGALLKAVLIGGAATIQGFEADTGLPVDPPPSFRQGFGRVFLGNSVYLAGNAPDKQLALLDAVPINQDETHSYCIRANGGSLSVTLVWTDYPASPLAEKALVHDLDLTVRAAGLNGVPLLGNGGSVNDPSVADRENNVEQVALDAIPPGLVSITVTGSTVVDAAGSPNYALVINGDFNGTLSKPGDGSQAPQCTILVAAITSGPSGVTNSDPVRFTFGPESGGGGGISFQCRLADASGNNTSGEGQHDWRDCTSPALYAGLPDGAYQFAVRGAGEDVASTQNFVLDRTPPSVSFNSAAPQQGASTPNATASIGFDGSDATGVNFTCTVSASGTVPLQPAVYSGSSRSAMEQLTLGQPYSCTSPQNLHWLLPGSWKVGVVATDAAGNAAPEQQMEWTVAFDQGAGLYTRFLSGPVGLQPKDNLTFTFVDLDASGQAAQAFTSHECWLEVAGSGGAADWKGCGSPYSLPSDTQDGSYRFHARVAGSTSGGAGTEAVATFQVDSVPPSVTILEAPDKLLSANATTVSFNSSEEGTEFFCGLARADFGAPAPSAIDPSAYYACTSPAALANLTDGSYLFGVYGVDAVGNEGKPALAAFLLDTTPPTFAAINFPTATHSPNVTVTFEAQDQGSGINNVTCRFRALVLTNGTAPVEQQQEQPSAQGDGGSGPDWTLCTSPQTYTGLQEGKYGLTLRASDKAGQSYQTPEKELWVDFTAPVVSLDGMPPMGEPVPSRTTFYLSELSGDPAGSFSNITSWQTLVETVADQATYSSLELAIQGGDTANVTAGGSSLTKSTNGSSTGDSATGAAGRRRLLQSGSGGAETVVPASAVGSWANCSAVCTYDGLDTGYYSIRVKAVDAAGNVGNATAKYPFQVDASLGKTPFPTWAIIASAVGGALVLGVLLYLLWRCCCAAPRRASAGVGGRPPQGAMHSPGTSSQYTYSPGSHAGYSPYGASYTAGYPSPGSGGAWGYPSAPPEPYAANGHGNGYGNGAPYPAAATPYTPDRAAAEEAAHAPGIDPVEAQRIALAQAAAAANGYAPAAANGHAPSAPQQTSPQRGPSGRRRAGGQAPSRQWREFAASTAAVDEERQVRLALEASLQEQQAAARREAEEAELRAAIEASLREQHSRSQRFNSGQ